MVSSFRFAHIALRAGLAVVFLWFAVSAFMQPSYWAETVVPVSVRNAVTAVGMNPTDLVVLVGIVEALIAASLLTGFFIRWFAALASVLLVLLSVTHGFDDRTVYHAGLIGALAALVLWPERHYT